MRNRTWDQMGQEHMDRQLYVRFHQDIYLPDEIRAAVMAFLPHKGTPLPLSDHYRRIQRERRLPASLYMPYTYNIVDVTVVKATNAIFRVLLRAPWNRRVDITLALEGDFEVVTAFWANPKDTHPTLDTSAYEPLPPSGSEARLLEVLDV